MDIHMRTIIGLFQYKCISVSDYLIYVPHNPITGVLRYFGLLSTPTTYGSSGVIILIIFGGCLLFLNGLFDYYVLGFR